MADNRIRLNKFLAERLGLSRREADDLISKGLVLIDDKVASLGVTVDNSSKVCYNKKVIPFEVDFSYYLFNKPVGYVCSRRAQGDAPTFYELLPKNMSNLKTVGRLDKDSSGLILLTDDGDFAFKMTHPKFQKTKIYEVRLDRPLQPLHQQMISNFGIQISDGISKLELTRLDEKRKCWQVEMSEGRNRQIRRTFGALGYTVTGLHRIQFGNYTLGDLKAGEFKKIQI